MSPPRVPSFCWRGCANSGQPRICRLIQRFKPDSGLEDIQSFINRVNGSRDLLYRKRYSFARITSQYLWAASPTVLKRVVSNPLRFSPERRRTNEYLPSSVGTLISPIGEAIREDTSLTNIAFASWEAMLNLLLELVFFAITPKRVNVATPI